MVSEPTRAAPIAGPPVALVDNPPPRTPLKKGSLAALIGVVAAAILFKTVPQEESGRTVRVEMAGDGSATLHQVAGPEYLKAYLDIAGVPTACDGITRGVKLGQRYTEAQCAALLEAALVEHARGVMACSPGLVGDDRAYPRAAAVSFGYNVGVGAWCHSSARRKIDAGDIRGGCDALLAWNKARVRGVMRPVAGLTARRRRERAICLKGL